jgi:hypothetical protein
MVAVPNIVGLVEDQWAVGIQQAPVYYADASGKKISGSPATETYLDFSGTAIFVIPFYPNAFLTIGGGDTIYMPQTFQTGNSIDEMNQANFNPMIVILESDPIYTNSDLPAPYEPGIIPGGDQPVTTFKPSKKLIIAAAVGVYLLTRYA